ncbi:hypothetical protein [Halorussus amylolyticus]|uniref:hypothetical protein n=1 Tax=Halorussus amylolyticus TaxID=1126242 RepID=UPI00104BECC5|nr:hypothetical protein [Halorussus amylolyticus]
MDSSTGAASGQTEIEGVLLVFVAIAVWLAIALAVNVGQTVLLAGVLFVGGGYFLLRLVRAVERLAAAAERLAETRE